MSSFVCSLCHQLMSPENAAEFAVEVPQIGKTLTFRACVACQEKATTHNLYICLGCKSISWFPSGNFVAHGVNYRVKFQCNRCMTQALTDALV